MSVRISLPDTSRERANYSFMEPETGLDETEEFTTMKLFPIQLEAAKRQLDAKGMPDLKVLFEARPMDPKPGSSPLSRDCLFAKKILHRCESLFPAEVNKVAGIIRSVRAES